MLMNKQEIEAKGERIHEVMGWWNSGISQAKNGYLLMGKCIHTVKQEKLWRIDGSEAVSFRHWVLKTLHISYAQANRLAQVFRELGHLLGSIEIDIAKVTLLLPYIHGESDKKKTDL